MVRSEGVTEKQLREVVFTRSRQVQKPPSWGGEVPGPGMAENCYRLSLKWDGGPNSSGLREDEFRESLLRSHGFSWRDAGRWRFSRGSPPASCPSIQLVNPAEAQVERSPLAQFLDLSLLGTWQSEGRRGHRREYKACSTEKKRN